VTHDPFSYAADEGVLQTSAAVGGHDDERRVQFASGFADGVLRRADEDTGCHRKAGRKIRAAELGESPFRLLCGPQVVDHNAELR
jgi:hypothetical protein